MERKSYEELTFSDNFMFNKVMLNKSVCRKVLSLLLNEDVGVLDDVRYEKNIQVTAQNKPVRLDIFTKDDKTLYDAEMQNQNNRSLESIALPRRSRYYQSMIDIDAIDSGKGYRELLDSDVIFICTFDPFELGLPVYTFTSRCSEELSFALPDGCTKYFFNVTADPNQVPDDLKAFFRYTVDGTATDELTKEIDVIVKSNRTNEEWRTEYMYFNIIEQDAKEEGREEGREEERAKTAQALLERDDALSEVARLKALLLQNGIKA